MSNLNARDLACILDGSETDFLATGQTKGRGASRSWWSQMVATAMHAGARQAVGPSVVIFAAELKVMSPRSRTGEGSPWHLRRAWPFHA